MSAEYPRPPRPRLHMNLSVDADSVDDLAEKLLDLSNEIALREEGEWNVASSRGWSYYTIFDPEMTPERFRAALREWREQRQALRREREAAK